MLFGFLIILVCIVIFGRYTGQKADDKQLQKVFEEKHSNDLWRRNPEILQIVLSLKYVKAYNKAVYEELKTCVTKILTMYYLFIGGNMTIHIDDFSHEKMKLAWVYEEMSMNVPEKYHARTKQLFIQLNRQLNTKMKLIKLKNSQSPIKISLMSAFTS